MLDLYSGPVDGPVAELPFFKRSLLFAELANVSYEPFNDVQKMSTRLGFTTLEFYQNDNAQAYRFQTKDDIIIVCRGTEGNKADILADLRAWPTKTAEGRVHQGFKEETDDLWENIVEDLVRASNREKNIYLLGHSMGGAMATIMSKRCVNCDELPNPVELHTFGSPRVAWRKYINTITTMHYRWVNNNDIICRLPTSLSGYKHHGYEFYINHKGKIRTLDGFPRFVDGLKGFISSLLKGRVDIFTDHLMDEYIKNIRHNL